MLQTHLEIDFSESKYLLNNMRLQPESTRIIATFERIKIYLCRKYNRLMNNAFYIKSLEKIKEGKLAEAILFLDKAIEEEPANPVYVSERGVCYLNLGQNERALKDMNQSVKLDPEYAYRYASRAFVKDKMGDIEGGIADYEIAVRLDPEDAIAYNNLGLMQEKLGYKKASERNFKRADKLADEDPDSLPNISKNETDKTAKPSVSLPPVGSIKRDSLWSIFTKIFTDSATRKEFITFIKKGGKVTKE